MGCDDNSVEDAQFQEVISIHAPTWGATIYTRDVYEALTISIHAPTWGATNIQKRGGDY